jgi:tetratricopeptide (TPR) repeat protein
MMAESTAHQSLQPTLAGSPPMQGEVVAFTGTLASMTHRQASELVEQFGGAAVAHVSRQTTMLVIGEEGWPLEEDGQPSQKLQQATELQLQGRELRVLSESDWLNLLGLTERRQEIQRLYTPAVLSKLLDVPVAVIRSWERAGLIQPVRRVYRLPYFDFQEVTSARKLSQLLAANIPRKEIEAGLRRLQAVLPDIDRPLAQLEILAEGSRVLYRDEAGLVEPASGQRVFDFDPPQPAEPTVAARPPVADETAAFQEWTADDWFVQGCRLLDENVVDAAIEAFRLCLMERPGDPEVNFHLADALYRQGNLHGAVERYHAAVEADHNYIEAWTQLGSIYDELGLLESALQAFEVALQLHPDYPDAHLHTADVLHQLGQTERAVAHWQRYLEYDSRGPWAESARQRLREVGCPEDDDDDVAPDPADLTETEFDDD